MSSCVEIYLLGGLRVCVDGLEIPRFRTRKSAAILAYLAYHTRFPVPREVLVDRFWPDDSPENARNSLNTALSSIRVQIREFAALREPFLVADRHTVKLNPGVVWTDAEAFRQAAATARRPGTGQEEAAQRALSLYGGGLLEGFYDEWILEEAAELETIRDSLLTIGGAKPIFSPPSEGEGPTNLPLISNRFVGRDGELSKLEAQHLELPLVTLVGFGGAGKTRIALELGRRLRRLDRPVWFVSFAGAHPAVSVADEIVRQLRVPMSSSDPVESLRIHWGDVPTTLILDNLEHLQTATSAIPKLLDGLRSVHLLATSRAALNLENETIFRLDGLPVPALEDELEMLRENPSAALFANRSSLVQPSFSINPKNWRYVRELCRRLEGNSLMIELAAARAQVFTVREMVEEMGRPLEFLVARTKDRSERHRSARAAIEWSYKLLSSEAREALPKIATASGGWSLSAATQILCEPAISEIFQELIDASFLRFSDGDDERRFTMHPILREYCAERLEGETKAELQRRRLRYLLLLAGKANPSRDWLQEVDQEVDNVRDCLSFASEFGWHETLARLTVGLAQYWELRGRFREGLSWLELSAASPELPLALRAQVLQTAGRLYGIMNDWDEADRCLAEAAAHFKELGDARGQARANARQALLRVVERRTVEADEMLMKTLQMLEEAGEPPDPHVWLANAMVCLSRNRLSEAIESCDIAGSAALAMADPLTALRTRQLKAEIHLKSGDWRQAEYDLIACLAEYRQQDDAVGSALALNGLGRVHYSRRNLRAALDAFRGVLQAAEQLGDSRLAAHARADLGKSYALLGDNDVAETMLSEADAALRRLNDTGMSASVAISLAILKHRSDRADSIRLLRRAHSSLRTDPESAELYDLARVAAQMLRLIGQKPLADRLSAASMCGFPDHLVADFTGENEERVAPDSTAYDLAEEALKILEAKRVPVNF